MDKAAHLTQCICETFGFTFPPDLSFVSGISADSRNVQENTLFFALSGSVTNGHYFLHEAFLKGAYVAVIASDYLGPIPKGMHVIRVKDTLAALQMLAQVVFKDTTAKKIAVTGSVGKTTTKEFISTLLSPMGKVLQTEGNHNSQIGLCLSLINQFRGDEKYIVAEMGMTHPSQITKLTQIIAPDVAVVTRVELVHAMNFSSFEKIAEAKAEIFDREQTQICIYNEDTHASCVLRERAKNGKSFSMNSNSPSATWKMRIEKEHIICIEGGKEYSLPNPEFLAAHVYENLLAAIAVVRSLQVPFDVIIDQIPSLKLLKNRLEIIRSGGVCFINDSYNASEISMISALDVLGKHAPFRRIAVLGKMGELGAFSDECHKRVGECALKTADCLFCLGEECAPMVDLWRKEKKECFWTYSLQELISQLQKKIEPNDVVLLKGSRSNCLWKIVEHFVSANEIKEL